MDRLFMWERPGTVLLLIYAPVNGNLFTMDEVRNPRKNDDRIELIGQAVLRMAGFNRPVRSGRLWPGFAVYSVVSVVALMM